METFLRSFSRIVCGLLLTLVLTGGAAAQGANLFTSLQVLTNKETLLRLTLATGKLYKLETSSNLVNWSPLLTFIGSTANSQFTDVGTPYQAARYYRLSLTETNNAAVGDIIPTADGEVAIQAVNHASFVMSWKGLYIYVDPVGGSARFAGIPRADLVLVTHAHGDHYESTTINSIKGSNCQIIAPASVQTTLPTALKTNSIPLANGQSQDFKGIKVEAFPMYNFSNQNHIKGVGNGYILTIGGKRFYIGGDTEDTPEMRALRDLDVAFIPMNVPFTMSVNKAAEAVKLMKPRIVFPYHYSGSDVNTFKRLMGTDTGVEVRLRRWY